MNFMSIFVKITSIVDAVKKYAPFVLHTVDDATKDLENIKRKLMEVNINKEIDIEKTHSTINHLKGRVEEYKEVSERAKEILKKLKDV